MAAKQRRAAAAGTSHPWPAWFQDTVQHAQLLTNRTLREYLLAHSAERWPELAKSTLLYGVLCLRRDFPGTAVVPLEQLHEAARRLHAEAALGAALPAIRSQFESLEVELGGCLAELAPACGAEGQAPHQWLQQGTAQAAPPPAPPGRRASAPDNVPTSALQAAVSQQRRPGAASVTASSEASSPPPPRRSKAAIYPDWWPGDASNTTASRRPSATVKQRPPPRLAYSRPPTAPPSVTADDLPTAAFLLVPPRVVTSSVGGGIKAGGSNAGKGGSSATAMTPGIGAGSRVKLQHAHRLALRRQVQQDQQEQQEQRVVQANQQSVAEHRCAAGGGCQATAICGSRQPAPGEPSETPALPRYHPQDVQRWMQHFGL